MLDVGVILPSVAVQRQEALDLQTAARHAEEVGLASVWHGDHLATGTDVVDCTIALAVAAVSTRHVAIGTSVLVPAIRPLAWAAKQIASLQHVSGGRLVLGVGSGGGPAQWAAAGVPFERRGPRTDTALTLLPQLVGGHATSLPDEPGKPTVQLGPAQPRPPVWVGNASATAIRRAARFGDGWFPSLVGPDQLAAGIGRLHEQRPDGWPVPTVCIGAAAALGPSDAAARRRQLAAGISEAYDRPLDDVLDVPLVGAPAAVAEQLAAHAAAGASQAVVGLGGEQWREQCELLGEVAALLRSDDHAARPRSG